MSTVDTNRRSATQIIKEMLEQGKSDEEIVRWITENLPHVKNPRAYLRATKSYLRKKSMQQAASAAEKAESGVAAHPLSTLGIQVQQVEIPRPKEKVEKEVEEAEAEETTMVEVDEEALASMYKGIVEIIGIVAVGEDFAFPEAKARSRAKLLKKIIEKHNLGDLPWEELSLLGGIAEDALFIVNKVKQKKAKEGAKSALGQKVEEEKKEEKAEEKKKEEQQQIKPDMRSLREKLKEIYSRASV